ncbi:DUF2920 family protein [Campylobacter lari]|uniref:DUF2920 family protein n=1 Tax=Campylobacter lari TaxID=201 RepID=UPI00087503E6|nr:DUF2920 family protein [Campylobacter lari]EAH4936396.1 DUF2920 family protein [Campylobacter lari]EAH6293335.1 DUF2920 family protein [Campylobacter lari]EAI0281778.1 DUF2920 family protein [Campylobacter lari]EAI0925179.1 DUF2920 family protein [Campylobacter lari]EAI2082465.1 DUF2920 family protein [Campylobacter lari]
MLKNETYFINSCDDVELGIKRESKLEYRISYDNEKTMKAIVFIIGGYGANANIEILDFYRMYFAKKFNVIAVSVFYHCFAVRRSNDQRYYAITKFMEEDIPNLATALNAFNISSFDLNINNADAYYTMLNNFLYNLKKNNEIDANYKVYLTSTFVPSNNEYQNYGIMAAIDHINVLKDIIKKYPKFKFLPKIYGGGSYGGYLALMCAKIAPWYVDGIIDNSGDALPVLDCIIGKELMKFDYIFKDPNIDIGCNIKTHWTRKDPNSPYYFADENYLIRALLNKDHLILQANKNKDIAYISYHSKKDQIMKSDYKIQLMEILSILYNDVTFYLIDEKDIDGKFIKNLIHGCGISDKALLSKELPLMLEKLKDKTFDIKEDSISYPCKDKVFTFKDKGDKFVLEII